jgi:hypothetical protein
MQLVFDGLFTLGAAFVALWLWSLRGSVVQDQAKAKKEAKTAREQAEREARLRRKGEPLRCLGCEKKFRGPLSENGCPRCHSASFVMPEAEYQDKRKQFGHGD